MTVTPLMSSEVEVATDPHTAFAAFTDELDLWWVRGPINNYDTARLVALRCEPGVGGRLLEVYDEAGRDVLELGRITVWEPGSRLAWHSSVDDVEIDVRFEAAAGGTRVAVAAYLPAGGTDVGGTSWVTMTPGWFGRWCARRDTAPRKPQELDRLAVAVHYAKPATAARWLASTFGFEAVAPIPPGDDGQMWIEFRVGNCSLVVLRLDDEVPDRLPATHVPWVFVDDLDAHLERAQTGGATVVEPIHQHGYRAYTAADLEGHHWTFAQARPGMLGGDER